jgi:2-keto-4-pentenoate hydratase
MANPQVIEDGDEIPLGSTVQPHVEAETAFVLEKDLAGPSVTSANALAAIAGALRAIEIIDSRVADHSRDLRHSRAGTFSPAGGAGDRRCAGRGADTSGRGRGCPSAIGAVFAAIKVIDSRCAGFRYLLLGVVAGNAGRREVASGSGAC